MTKYIFTKIKDPDNHFDTTNVTVELETESLPDILEAFTEYLNACGFSVKELTYEYHNDCDCSDSDSESAILSEESTDEE